MWVFLNNAFLSIVQDRNDLSRLLVRSRIMGDIQTAFKDYAELDVFEMGDADYRYRAFIPREVVADRLALAVRHIDYDNFKGSIRDQDRLHTAHALWQVWHDAV